MRCAVCSRVLKSPKSIEQGMGDTCYSKMMALRTYKQTTLMECTELNVLVIAEKLVNALGNSVNCKV